MEAGVGSRVHPRYKGIAEWDVKAIAELPNPIEWGNDSLLGEVSYKPKILWLGCQEYKKVVWFAYWIATSRTKGKVKWGAGPPILEEDTFLELMRSTIQQGFFTKGFLKELKGEIEIALNKQA
jgi:hypothetical protein